MLDLHSRHAAGHPVSLNAAESARLHTLLRLSRPQRTGPGRFVPSPAWLPAAPAALEWVDQLVPASVALYFAFALLHLFGRG